MEAIVISNRFRDKSRGYGFVTFSNPNDAMRAVKNGAKIDGIKVHVSYASRNPKPTKASNTEHGNKGTKSSLNGNSCKIYHNKNKFYVRHDKKVMERAESIRGKHNLSTSVSDTKIVNNNNNNTPQTVSMSIPTYRNPATFRTANIQHIPPVDMDINNNNNSYQPNTSTVCGNEDIRRDFMEYNGIDSLEVEMISKRNNKLGGNQYKVNKRLFGHTIKSIGTLSGSISDDYTHAMVSEPDFITPDSTPRPNDLDININTKCKSSNENISGNEMTASTTLTTGTSIADININHIDTDNNNNHNNKIDEITLANAKKFDVPVTIATVVTENDLEEKLHFCVPWIPDKPPGVDTNIDRNDLDQNHSNSTQNNNSNNVITEGIGNTPDISNRSNTPEIGDKSRENTVQMSNHALRPQLEKGYVDKSGKSGYSGKKGLDTKNGENVEKTDCQSKLIDMTFVTSDKVVIEPNVKDVNNNVNIVQDLKYVDKVESNRNNVKEVKDVIDSVIDNVVDNVVDSIMDKKDEKYIDKSDNEVSTENSKYYTTEVKDIIGTRRLERSQRAKQRINENNNIQNVKYSHRWIEIDNISPKIPRRSNTISNTLSNGISNKGMNCSPSKTKDLTRNFSNIANGLEMSSQSNRLGITRGSIGVISDVNKNSHNKPPMSSLKLDSKGLKGMKNNKESKETMIRKQKVKYRRVESNNDGDSKTNDVYTPRQYCQDMLQRSTNNNAPFAKDEIKFIDRERNIITYKSNRRLDNIKYSMYGNRSCGKVLETKVIVESGSSQKGSVSVIVNNSSASYACTGGTTITGDNDTGTGCTGGTSGHGNNNTGNTGITNNIDISRLPITSPLRAKAKEFVPEHVKRERQKYANKYGNYLLESQLDEMQSKLRHKQKKLPTQLDIFLEKLREERMIENANDNIDTMDGIEDVESVQDVQDVENMENVNNKDIDVSSMNAYGAMSNMSSAGENDGKDIGDIGNIDKIDEMDKTDTVGGE